MIQPILYAAAMTLGGFVGATPPGTLPAAATANAAQEKVIVHIVSRDETVTIKSGPSSLLYSLTGVDGKTIIANATPEKFEELRPELFRKMKHFIAVKNDDAPIATATGFAGID